MKNAVGYVRVSTQEQVDNFSLINQEQSIHDYCASSEIKLKKVFREEGKSAKTIDGRGQLKEMLEYCYSKANDVSYVVVYHPDRFARNMEDHMILTRKLSEQNIEVKYVIVPSDNTASGKLIVMMNAVFAQYDNDLKSDRTKTGIKKALEEGRWTGKAPLGYLRNRESKVPSLVIDKERAENIRFIFDQVDLGIKTKAGILREVTLRGLVNAKDKPLTNQAIDKMLVNPIYSGMVYSKKNDFIGKGDFEPIVSKEQFDRVNAKPGKLAGIAHTGRDGEFPLRRFVVCGNCGVTITGSESKGRRKRYKYYRCKNNKCNAEKIPLIDLELQYLEELDSLSAKPSTFDLLEAIMRDVWQAKIKDIDKAQKANKRRLQDLSEKKESLNELFIYKKHIDVETYNSELQKIADETKLLESEMADESIQEEKFSEIIAKAKSYFTNLPYCWNRLQSPVRKQFQKLVHPDGMILKDGKLGTPRKSWLFIDFVDLKTQSNTCAPPRINDWNRLEEWISGLAELTELLDYAGIEPFNPGISYSSTATGRDWNQL